MIPNLTGLSKDKAKAVAIQSTHPASEDAIRLESR